MRIPPLVLILATTASAYNPSSRPTMKRSLLAASLGTDQQEARRSTALVVTGTAGSVSMGSIALLVFAYLQKEPVPIRSLAAAGAVLFASILMESAGFSLLRRNSLASAAFSETGQALAIGACGWCAFSGVWASGFGSVLTPGRKFPLNLAAVFGCFLGAIFYSQHRQPSLAQTLLPFACALLMLHLHLIVTPDVQEYRLAPLALATAGVALAAIFLHNLVQHALQQVGRHRGRGRRAAAAITTTTHVEVSRIMGTRSIMATALCVNLIWVFLTLAKWSVKEAPYWGFATVAVALSAVQLALHPAITKPNGDGSPAPSLHHKEKGDDSPAVQGAPVWGQSSDDDFFKGQIDFKGFDDVAWGDVGFDEFYRLGFYCLAALGAWRAFWVGDAGWMEHLSATGRLWRHFYSLVITFGLWSAVNAAYARTFEAAVGGGMVVVTIGLTLLGSLFGEPLLLAGLLGLACGVALLGGVAYLLNEPDESGDIRRA